MSATIVQAAADTVIHHGGTCTLAGTTSTVVAWKVEGDLATPIAVNTGSGYGTLAWCCDPRPVGKRSSCTVTTGESEVWTRSRVTAPRTPQEAERLIAALHGISASWPGTTLAANAERLVDTVRAGYAQLVAA